MADWLVRAAAMRPERVAIDSQHRSLTYRELLACAREVRVADVEPLELDELQAFVVRLHACLLRGSAAVPIDPRLSAAEQSERRAVSVVGEGVATVMYTSGTTAAGKPVELTYDNWLAGALGSAVALGLDREERWLCAMPLAHVGGLSILIRSVIYGTTVVLHERFETEAALAALMDPSERVTLVSLVPTMLARLLEAGLTHPPALRWVLLGGGPIPASLLERAARAGVPVAPTYGMTEACSQIATNGWPLPGIEVSVAGDGEVLVRGPSVARGALAADGWLHTGDLGALDDAGRLVITGRKAETIVSGGENVAPSEVEAVLLAHPAVADAAVFGRAEVEWGEAVIAAVVLCDGMHVSAEELREHCAERLARFKVPKALEVRTSLPRTPSGKLLRGELR